MKKFSSVIKNLHLLRKSLCDANLYRVYGANPMIILGIPPLVSPFEKGHFCRRRCVNLNVNSTHTTQIKIVYQHI